MHSDKINYKEEIYKPLLEEGLLNDVYLILPLSKKYEASYIKELLSDSDIIICDLTKNNFFLKAEIKMATKLKKDIYYFVNTNDKNKKQYNNIIEYEDRKDFISKVRILINSLNKKEILLKRDNIFCLGKVQK